MTMHPARRPQDIATPRQLRGLIARLSPVSPMTDRFSAQWRALNRTEGQQEQKHVWYRTQHQHWLGWLRAYEGPGGYGRADWNRSARFVYSHVDNPQMPIYLAEASGLPKALVRRAAAAALERPSAMVSMSAAIRRVITWEAVKVALTGPR